MFTLIVYRILLIIFHLPLINVDLTCLYATYKNQGIKTFVTCVLTLQTIHSFSMMKEKFLKYIKRC